MKSRLSMAACQRRRCCRRMCRGWVSDVVNLSGIPGRNPLRAGHELQRLGSCDPKGSKHLRPALGTIYLGWLNPDILGNGSNIAQWENAMFGNTGNNASALQQNYQGSFAQFQSLYGINLSSYVGAWGIDSEPLERRRHWPCVGRSRPQ